MEKSKIDWWFNQPRIGDSLFSNRCCMNCLNGCKRIYPLDKTPCTNWKDAGPLFSL